MYHVCGLQERCYSGNRNEDRFVVAVMSHDDIVGHVRSVNNFTLGASSSIEVAYYVRSLGILSTKETFII